MKRPTPSELISVAVATVTYGDRAKLLSQTLEGIFTQTAQDRISRVVVCDNGAGKESKALLANTASREHRLRVVNLPENMGSARGYVEAIRTAAAPGCEYIWCLDDDNLAYPDALERLLDATRIVEPGAALLSLREDRPQYVRRSRGASVEGAFERPYSFLGFSVLDLPKKIRRRLVVYEGEADQKAAAKEILAKVPYAPYGGFLFKAELLSEVGLPDIDFFMYSDDHEFTARFATRGYPIYLVPDSRVKDIELSWHLSASDRGRWRSRMLLSDDEEESLVRQFYSIRNRAFFESHRLAWGKNPLYMFNAANYLLLLLVQALLLRGLGQRMPWLSFTVILSAAKDGWRGLLGKASEEVTYSGLQ